MRTIKTLALLSVLLVTVSSCNFLFGNLFNSEDEQLPLYYNLALSFRDASGKDLVKDIAEADTLGTVDSEEYALDVAVYDPCSGAAIPGVSPILMVRYDNDYSYLASSFILPASNCAEKQLTYRLKCPYIFGDDAEHELVTYWSTPTGNVLATCYSGEFDGKSISLQVVGEFYAVTITLAQD